MKTPKTVQHQKALAAGERSGCRARLKVRPTLNFARKSLVFRSLISHVESSTSFTRG